LQSPNSESALPIRDDRQQTRKGTCVPQVAVNAAASVKLVIPEGGKYEKNPLF